MSHIDLSESSDDPVELRARASRIRARVAAELADQEAPALKSLADEAIRRARLLEARADALDQADEPLAR